MKVKDLENLFYGLNERLTNLEKSISNHCSEHVWDRILKYGQLTLMIIIILLLKFKLV